MNREFCFCNWHLHRHIIEGAYIQSLDIWAGNEIQETFPEIYGDALQKTKWEGPLSKEQALKSYGKELLLGLSNPNIDDCDYFIDYTVSYLKNHPEGRLLFQTYGELDTIQRQLVHHIEKLRNRLKRKCIYHNRSKVWVLEEFEDEWSIYFENRKSHNDQIVRQNREYAKKYLM